VTGLAPPRAEPPGKHPAGPLDRAEITTCTVHTDATSCAEFGQPKRCPKLRPGIIITVSEPDALWGVSPQEETPVVGASLRKHPLTARTFWSTILLLQGSPHIAVASGL